jgi:NTE family protein
MIFRMAALMLSLAVLSAQPNRPKIALVLEGGAALGFAHVGVLEWLEKNQIPVDMIAGASMGGLIGGLYAAGYSPQEIRDIASNADWPMLLGGETSFRALAYRRKEDRLAFPNRIELGLKGGLSLPAGFNEGHQIGLMLSRLTLGYPTQSTFDALPTPFRCVSADLVSGESKVWDRGLLNEALRSTMSIPAMFSPVRKDGGIYVDGGLLDNLPVNVAKQMGADIVIAVHLSKGPVDPKKIGTLVEVMGRSVSVVIGASEMRTISLADLVLVAELSKFNTTDYAKHAEIIDSGFQAAEAKASMLRRFALNASDYQSFQAARKARIRKIPMDAPKFISVIGGDSDTNASVRERLAQLTSRGLTPNEFESELTKIVGLGRFASLGYQQAVRGSDVGLEVSAVPKPGGPVFLTPGFEINGVDATDTRFSLGARINWIDIWGFRSELRSDFWFGSRFGASSEIYKPLRPNSRFFLAPRIYVDSNPFDLYVLGAPISSYRLRQQGASLDAGISINRFSELRLGYQFNWFKANQRIGLPIQELSTIGFRRDALSMRYQYEGQDDAIVARRGLRIGARAEYYPAYGYSLGEIRSVFTLPVSAQNSLVTAFSGGGTVGPPSSSLLTFTLGGPQRLGAYGINEILARNYALGTFGILHEVKSQPSLLGSKLFVTGFVQGARTYDIFRDLRYPVNATGSVILRTLFGPIFIGGSVGDRGHRKWFFGVGRLF